jgi:hypothetical protein
MSKFLKKLGIETSHADTGKVETTEQKVYVSKVEMFKKCRIVEDCFAQFERYR